MLVENKKPKRLFPLTWYELKKRNLIGFTEKCIRCGERHEVEYSRDLKEKKIIGSVRCKNGRFYLSSINFKPIL